MIKCTYMPSGERLRFHLEAETLPDLWNQIARIDEAFSHNLETCGQCGHWATQHKLIPTQSGGQMRLLECPKCNASLPLTGTRDNKKIYAKKTWQPRNN